jgi:hypothetical protein
MIFCRFLEKCFGFFFFAGFFFFFVGAFAFFTVQVSLPLNVPRQPIPGQSSTMNEENTSYFTCLYIIFVHEIGSLMILGK